MKKIFGLKYLEKEVGRDNSVRGRKCSKQLLVDTEYYDSRGIGVTFDCGDTGSTSTEPSAGTYDVLGRKID